MVVVPLGGAAAAASLGLRGRAVISLMKVVAGRHIYMSQEGLCDRVVVSLMERLGSPRWVGLVFQCEVWRRDGAAPAGSRVRRWVKVSARGECQPWL